MERRDELLKVHGDDLCHICGQPKIGPGLDICSYPHGMLPYMPVDPEHPEGFWAWKEVAP